jgi:hypothetical protein
MDAPAMLAERCPDSRAVVDLDVNVRDLNQVRWALSPRCQPDTGAMIFPPMVGAPLRSIGVCAPPCVEDGLRRHGPARRVDGARHERVFAPGADQMSWEALAALAQDLDGVGAVRSCALVEGEQ